MTIAPRLARFSTSIAVLAGLMLLAAAEVSRGASLTFIPLEASLSSQLSFSDLDMAADSTDLSAGIWDDFLPELATDLQESAPQENATFPSSVAEPMAVALSLDSVINSLSQIRLSGNDPDRNFTVPILPQVGSGEIYVGVYGSNSAPTTPVTPATKDPLFSPTSPASSTFVGPTAFTLPAFQAGQGNALTNAAGLPTWGGGGAVSSPLPLPAALPSTGSISATSLNFVPQLIGPRSRDWKRLQGRIARAGRANAVPLLALNMAINSVSIPRSTGLARLTNVLKSPTYEAELPLMPENELELLPVAYQIGLSSLVKQLDDVYAMKVSVDLRLLPAQILLTPLDLDDQGYRRSRLLTVRPLAIYSAQETRRKEIQKELWLSQYRVLRQQDDMAVYMKKSQAQPIATPSQSNVEIGLPKPAPVVLSQSTLPSLPKLSTSKAPSLPLRANPYSSPLLQSRRSTVALPQTMSSPPGQF